mmetsp:Transcript_30142/g.96203  ORF Transcript_30142/g.96203 Transcript_30142/m.96203 type:complete len:229 (-) Transcript_30142:1925-2611(-)
MLVDDRLVVCHPEAPELGRLRQHRKGALCSRAGAEATGDLQHPLGLCKEQVRACGALQRVGRRCCRGAQDMVIQATGALQLHLGLCNSWPSAPHTFHEGRGGVDPEAARDGATEHCKHPLGLRQAADQLLVSLVFLTSRSLRGEVAPAQAAGALRGDLGSSPMLPGLLVLFRCCGSLLCRAPAGVFSECAGQPGQGRLDGEDQQPAVPRLFAAGEPDTLAAVQAPRRL